jgi:hypothetical protein
LINDALQRRFVDAQQIGGPAKELVVGNPELLARLQL